MFFHDFTSCPLTTLLKAWDTLLCVVNIPCLAYSRISSWCHGGVFNLVGFYTAVFGEDLEILEYT